MPQLFQDPESLFAVEVPDPNKFEVARIGKFFDFFMNNRLVGTIAEWGSAGSGKSQACVQEMVDRFFAERDIRILMVRKTGPALTDTVWQMTIDELDARGYKEGVDYRMNRSSQTMWHKENIMMFRSLDKEAKKKSLNINYAYIEEATEISLADYTQIELRVRRENHNKGAANQVLMSFNPVDPYHWTNTEILQKVNGADIVAQHSVFGDNPFLPESYRRKLMSLVGVDQAIYQIYALGEYAIIKNVIYSHYIVDAKFPPNIIPLIYGLDFGFNVPTAMVAIYRGPYNELFAREMLYRPKMTNAQIIDFLKANLPLEWRHRPIYVDPAEPDRILEIKNAGFRCEPATKAVKKGIDTVKSTRFHVLESDINLLAEIRSYKWKETSNGVVLDEPVKFHDHLMDALRYAIHSHFQFGVGDFIPIDKAVAEDGTMAQLQKDVGMDFGSELPEAM